MRYTNRRLLYFTLLKINKQANDLYTVALEFLKNESWRITAPEPVRSVYIVYGSYLLCLGTRRPNASNLKNTCMQHCGNFGHNITLAKLFRLKGSKLSAILDIHLTLKLPVLLSCVS